MPHIKDKYLLPIALLLYCILWSVVHPLYTYLLDSDATAYLTIAERMARGEYLQSINGLWSPLNCWLMVPFLKLGANAWLVAKGLNAFFAAVLLAQAFYLFKKLKFNSFALRVLTFTLVPILVMYAYYQIFGDVLQLIFALAYVHLFITKDFLLQRKYVLLAAIIMGVGFYAKAYSFIFFGAHFTIIAFIAWRKSTALRKEVLVNYVLGIVTIVAVVLPWSFQLEKKYGAFSLTGHAGKLNMSWYINSGKTFKPEIDLLIPPPYDDSPSFWEDPYVSQGQLSTPLSSGHHFYRWVLRVGHTCIMALKCVTQISLGFILIVLLLLYSFYKRNDIPEPYLSILLALIILPLGYLAMHIETRYIWLSTFLLMPLGMYLINTKVVLEKRPLFILLFAFSFLPFLIKDYVQLAGKNKELFEMAEELKANDISGKIATNINDEGSFWVVSYLAGLNNYTIEQSDYSLQELANEMKRYDVKHYIHYPDQGGAFVTTDEGFNELFKLKHSSLKLNYSYYQLVD